MRNFLLALFLGLSSMSFGQSLTGSPVAVNQNGVPLPSTLVTVCLTNPGTGTCGSLATLFTDNTLANACTGTNAALNSIGSPLVTTACSNPGFTDALGNVTAFAALGFYWCQYSRAGILTYSQPCPSSGGGGGGGGTFSGLNTTGANGINTNANPWAIAPGSSLGGSAPYFTINGVSGETDTAPLFALSVPATTTQPAMLVSSGGNPIFSLCNTGAASYVPFAVVGSGIPCANLTTSPISKLWSIAVTSTHAGATILDFAVGYTANLLQLHAKTAAGTGFNFLTACPGASSVDGSCPGGNIVFSVRGDGMVTTPSITLAGGTPLTSQSSANSQIVTCPTGGSGTQVCDAAGAWVANGSGSGTVTASPQYQVAIYPTAGTVATVQGSANLTTDAGGDFSATGKLAAGSTSVTGPMCTGVSGAWCAAENSTAGTPTSGGCYIRADSTTNALKYSCNGGAEALLVSPGFPVTTPQTVNGAPSTGAITPNQATIPNPVGQIIGTGDWYMQAPSFTIPPAPSLTINTTGGTYVNGTQLYVRLTYAGFSAGNTQPSGEVVSSAPNGMTGCSGGNSCSVTVTMPTSCTAGNLPAGATGCTVWDATGGGTNTEQIVAACTNITAITCTLTAAPTGTALTFQATTGITPPNFHTAGLISNNIVPLSWLNKSDLNNYPLFGIDTGGRNNAQPHDILTLLQPLSYNDAFQNAYYGITNTGGISIVHEMGHNVNSTCSASNLCIDPALSIRYDDAFATGTTWEQSLGMYAERFLNNTSFVCSPVSGETCAGSIRANVTDLRTGGTSLSPQGPVAGIAGAAFNNQGASHASTPTAQAGYVGGAFQAQDGTTSAYNEGAQSYIGVTAQATYVGLGTNAIGYGFKTSKSPTSFPGGSYGEAINNFTTASNLDYGLLVDGGNLYFGGNSEALVYLDNVQTNHGTIGVTGSLGVTGDVATAPLNFSGVQGSVTPVGGTATTWTYRLGCVSATGAIATANDIQTTLGAANLNGTTTENVINLPAVSHACTSINIYLTSSGGGTCGGVSCNAPGLIGTFVVPQAPNVNNLLTASMGSFTHGVQVASGTEPAVSSNTTGGISAVNPTAATVGASQSSPFIQALGTEWNGASVAGGGQFQFVPGTGVNAPSFFQLSHFGAATGSMALELPSGTTANPSLVFAANTTAGFYSSAANKVCFAQGNNEGVCLNANTVGATVGNTGAYNFSQTAPASGAIGASIGVVGTGVNEVINPSTQLLLPQCKIKTAITLSTASTTICSWNLPNSAQTWAWQCSGTYTITAGTTPDFGLGMNASQTPTSETGNALISSISASTASTQAFTGDSNTAAASGNQPIYTSTVAITTVTNSPWTSSGVLQASATAGTFAITGILTGTTPAGTVNPGTTCQLY